MTLKNDISIGEQFCKIFGLDPKEVSSIVINIEPESIVYVTIGRVIYNSEIDPVDMKLMRGHTLIRRLDPENKTILVHHITSIGDDKTCLNDYHPPPDFDEDEYDDDHWSKDDYFKRFIKLTTYFDFHIDDVYIVASNENVDHLLLY